MSTEHQDNENEPKKAASSSDSSTTDERIVEILEHNPGDVVKEKLEFTSAVWERLVLESPDDLDVEQWIHQLVRHEIGRSNQEYAVKKQVDIHIDAELWERIRLLAIHKMQSNGRAPGMAFHDAVNDLVEVSPNVIVDGEVVGRKDILPNGWDQPAEWESNSEEGS